MTLRCGDCLDMMRGMPDNSVDMVLTDRRTALASMGVNGDWTCRAWKSGLKLFACWNPGGHLLAFAGTAHNIGWRAGLKTPDSRSATCLHGCTGRIPEVAHGLRGRHALKPAL